MTPAVRAIVYANLGAFALTLVARPFMLETFGLTPEAVLERGRVWQLVTYLFVHSPTDFFHIVFNMLAVWMFGVELERRWGTNGFTKYYFVTGVGAGACVALASLLPFESAARGYSATTVGASGAVYGLLMAWALIWPHRQIIFIIFPITVRVLVLIFGGIAFLSAVTASGGAVSNLAHLSGLLIGWLYLRGPKDLQLAFKYRLTKWRMDRMRRKFNVHRGGRDDWENRIH
jgi:membrane associated rhomboid family serine protease